MSAKVKAGPIIADRLQAFIHRIERMEEEQAALAGDKRDIYAEAKGVGYDVKTMRKVIALRKMDAADRDEQETLLDVYLHALGMADRIEARATAGESAREIAAAEGVSKSTAHRVSQKARNAENGTVEPPLQADPPAIPKEDAGQREDGESCESGLIPTADVRKASVSLASEPSAVLTDTHVESLACPSTPPQPRECSTTTVIGKDDAVTSHTAMRDPSVLVTPTNEMGAVAAPKAQRIASSTDDDLTIPFFLDRRLQVSV